MAKRICRTADRFDPTGMPRPRCCVRRVPPPSPTAVVHEILQWRPHASILGEGCAVLACSRTGWADSLPPNSRRAASPICPDLIFDRPGHKPKAIAGEYRTWLLERIKAKDFTLRGLVAELAEHGLKVDYRSVWEFVHAEKLSFNKNRSGWRTRSPRRRAAAGAVGEVSRPGRT